MRFFGNTRGKIVNLFFAFFLFSFFIFSTTYAQVVDGPSDGIFSDNSNLVEIKNKFTIFLLDKIFENVLVDISLKSEKGLPSKLITPSFGYVESPLVDSVAFFDLDISVDARVLLNGFFSSIRLKNVSENSLIFNTIVV